ncbi:hypothetical protein [Flavobacterium suncheonense]|uniref:Uncharacterized protein n=1 Tax=Flavobacterium suncheonense GH29-5 = DSM 17707 TaxID=1121899 RepID=A0A0A2MA47_9FLAO|nr:hypothetical protein [Flavobacterium suncheonense]KGO89547.1 hypothetical protein Q764_07190 [Flavobacterium suncheonense GH29-5 = DSM 17707]
MKKTNRGLGNPAAVAAVASTSAGQKALDKSMEAIPMVAKWVAALGLIGLTWYLVSNRFVRWDYNNAYPKSNISQAQAEARAEAIYTAMFGIGNGFEIVKQQIAGLNYNGFIMLYNAFGIRKSATNIPFINKDEGTLVEWIQNQFSESEKAQLRFLIGNSFF